MSTAGSKAGLDTFDRLEINYERACGENPLKKACVEKAIPLIPPGRKVLDVGCGTCKPVSEMLSNAGLDVVGVDISPKMIGHAKSRVKGTFVQADLLVYKPEEDFAAIFIMFSLLQLTSYADFHGLMIKYSRALQPGGYLVLGTLPADNYVKNDAAYDETGTYVVGGPAPFMGGMDPNFLLTSKGLVDLVSSMGLEVKSNDIGVFQPNDPRCVPEDQQYVIAQRLGNSTIQAPQLRPKGI